MIPNMIRIFGENVISDISGTDGTGVLHPQDGKVLHRPNSLPQLNYHSSIKPKGFTVLNKWTSLLHILNDTSYLSFLGEFLKIIPEYHDLDENLHLREREKRRTESEGLEGPQTARREVSGRLLNAKDERVAEKDKACWAGRGHQEARSREGRAYKVLRHETTLPKWAKLAGRGSSKLWPSGIL